MKLRYNGRFETKPATGNVDDPTIYPGEVREFDEFTARVLLDDPAYEAVHDATPEHQPEWDSMAPLRERLALHEEAVARIAAMNPMIAAPREDEATDGGS